MLAHHLPELMELRHQTLSVAGLQGISPSSCEFLALLISEQTRHQISAATLQRVYGLQNSLHAPSTYTLDTLSRFCGFNGWGDWCRYQRQFQTVMPPELRECRDFNKLFYLTAEPMWLFHTESLRFLEVNQAAVRKYGYSRDRFLEMSILDIRPSEDKAMVLQEIAQAGEVCHHRSVYRHQLADGDLVNVEIVSYAMQLPEGNARLVLPIRSVLTQ